MAVTIRPETAADQAAVWAVNRAAFPGSAEADLVDRLRAAGAATLSLLALAEGRPVGHLCCSPVTLDPADPRPLLGLAPMAVLPDYQRLGIGGKLIEAALAEARRLGYAGMVVLGHPDYYPRFGFRPAQEFGLACTYDVPAEAFMAQALVSEGLTGLSGHTVHYHPAFQAL